MDFFFGSKSPEDKLIDTLNNPRAFQWQIDRALKNISSQGNYNKPIEIFNAMKSRRDREASLSPPKSSSFIWSYPGRLENADLTTVLTIAQKCLKTADTSIPISQLVRVGDSTLLSKSSDQSIDSIPTEQAIQKIARIITQSSSNKPIQKRIWSWVCFSQKPTALNQEEKPASTTELSEDDLKSLNRENEELFKFVGYNRLKKLSDLISEQNSKSDLISEQNSKTDNLNKDTFLNKIERSMVAKLDIPGNQEVDELIKILKNNHENSKEFARALKKIEALPYISFEKKDEIISVLNSKKTTTEDTSELVKQQNRFYRFKKRINSFFEVNIQKRIKDLIEKLSNGQTQLFLTQESSPLLPSEGQTQSFLTQDSSPVLPSEGQTQSLKSPLENKLPEDFTHFKAVQNLTAYSIPQQDGSFKPIDVAKEMKELFSKGNGVIQIKTETSVVECPESFAKDFMTGRSPIEFCGHNFDESRSKETGQDLTDAFSLVKSEYEAMCKAIKDQEIDPNALFVIIHQGVLTALSEYAGYFMVKLGDKEKDLIRYKAIPPSVKASFEGNNFVIEYESDFKHETRSDSKAIGQVSWKRTVTIPISELQKISVKQENGRYVLRNIPENIQATDSWGDYTVLS